MNTFNLASTMLANVTLIIDRNGQFREQAANIPLRPDDVVIQISDGPEPQVSAELVVANSSGSNTRLDGEIAQIIEQLELGADPTLNPDLATAAGGENGSSLTTSGSIIRTGDEVLAATSFDTSGLEALGLSATQSLALVDVLAQTVGLVEPNPDLLSGSDSAEADETNIPLVLDGTLVVEGAETLTFIPQVNVAGAYGQFSIDAEGNWIFSASSAFDGLNTGDAIADQFEVVGEDGSIHTVTVTINGTNDTPVFVDVNNDGYYSFAYDEGQVEGQPLGQVSATDPDNEVLVFTIKTNQQDEQGNALYQINSETGEISLTVAGVASLANDFERLDNTHNIVVTVTEADGEGTPLSTDIDVVLNERDRDDNAPVFDPDDPNNPDGTQYQFSYNENRTSSDVLGTVQASDADGEDITYSISANVFDDDGNALFSIDAESGAIRLTDAGVAAFANDFELDPNQHTITVTATEVAGLGEQQSTDIPVQLTELNLDDNAPVFDPDDPNNPDGTQYQFSYNENRTSSDVLGTVQASDGDGEDITYSISANVFDDDGNALFSIDADSGALRLTDAGVAAFANDFELDPNQHTITVTATEVAGLGEQQSTDIPVQLTELNLDDDAPVFDPDDPNNPDGTQYQFSYNENRTSSDVVGTVQASDADGEDITYSISANVFDDDGNALFSIDADSGAIRLTDAGVAAFANDFELDPNQHTITVTATEVAGLGEQQSTDIPVQLTELNLDDNAPVFDPDDPNNPDGTQYQFSYNENRTSSDVLGTVQASDGDGEDITYSISANVFDDDGNALFSIDADSGAIRLTDAGVAAFANDFELDPNQHTITVTATEVAGLGEQQSTDIPVQLTELNLDDNAPVFDPDDPNNPDGTQYQFSYNENRTSSDVLGTVQASDADGEDITYSISANVFDDDGNALFSIDADSGAIRLTDAGVAAFANDFELDPNQHTITVTATEVAGLGEQQSTDIPVQLTELNLDDNAPVFDPDDPNNPDGTQYQFSYNENRTSSDVLGTVQASDGDGEDITYSISANVFDDDGNALFSIDADSGAIRLTDAGVAAFANDFELDPNQHTITVTATEVAGLGEQQSTDIPVQLTELNLDDNAPVFDGNDPDGYVFSYDEGRVVTDTLGKVTATDADGEAVTFSIVSNVYNSDGKALFAMNSVTGALSLTSFGVEAFTNNYELESNIHNLVVRATEDAGLGEVKFTDINVELRELNVNELPVAEDFTVLLGDSMESTIVFDSDVPDLDHISDVDDDFSSIQLMIVLTSLPDSGTLLYTDENGVTRELTGVDVYVEGQDKVLLNPNNISFVPEGKETVIGSSDDGSLTDNNDGTYTFTLDSGNTVDISASKVNGNNTVDADVTLIEHNTQGTGFSVEGGSGINTTESLSVDLSNNPFYKITFAVDGLNNNHVATVTFTFEDNTTHTEYYNVNQTDYSFVSQQPIVQMDFSASSNDGTSGSNYVVTYLSGSETVAEDTSFNYMAVDSDDQLSNQATVTLDADSTTPSFDVVIGEEGQAQIYAQMGNDLLIGYDGQADVFIWLDSALDNSTDVVRNFELGSDVLDLSSVLTDGETFTDLLDKVTIDEVQEDDENITLQVDHDGSQQSIVIENGVDIFDITAPLDSETTNAILNQIVKNDTV